MNFYPMDPKSAANFDAKAKILAEIRQWRDAAEDYADDIAINGDPSATDHGGIWEHVKDLEPIKTEVHPVEIVDPVPPIEFSEIRSRLEKIIYDTAADRIERMILECDE